MVSQGAGKSGQMTASSLDGPEGSLLWRGKAVLSLGRAPSRECFPPMFPHSLHRCQLNDCIMFCGAGIP